MHWCYSLPTCTRRIIRSANIAWRSIWLAGRPARLLTVRHAMLTSEYAVDNRLQYRIGKERVKLRTNSTLINVQLYMYNICFERNVDVVVHFLTCTISVMSNTLSYLNQPKWSRLPRSFKTLSRTIYPAVTELSGTVLRVSGERGEESWWTKEEQDCK